MVFFMISGGGGMLCNVGGELLCVLGDLPASYVLGIGMGSRRDNCGHRAMYSYVYLGMVSVCSPLLAWVLLSSSNPVMLSMSLTTISSSYYFTYFTFKSPLNYLAAIVSKLVIFLRNCHLTFHSFGLDLVRHL